MSARMREKWCAVVVSCAAAHRLIVHHGGPRRRSSWTLHYRRYSSTNQYYRMVIGTCGGRCLGLGRCHRLHTCHIRTVSAGCLTFAAYNNKLPTLCLWYARNFGLFFPNLDAINNKCRRLSSEMQRSHCHNCQNRVRLLAETMVAAGWLLEMLVYILLS